MGKSYSKLVLDLSKKIALKSRSKIKEFCTKFEHNFTLKTATKSLKNFGGFYNLKPLLKDTQF